MIMKHEDSLFRPDLEPNDFIDTTGGEECGEALDVGNGIRHFCTRPSGHSGQHYSFRGGYVSYEIVWPATP
jgi:hypothetical protein